MARATVPCTTCGGDTGVQGCSHEMRLDPSQIAWRKACEKHDKIRRAGRPSKNSPLGGGLSVEQIVEETDGLSLTLFEEALAVRRKVVTNTTDVRWAMLDRGEITVGSVYDAHRVHGQSAHKGAGGTITALDAAARNERDRRFTQNDLGNPYRAMVQSDFVDVATEVLDDGTNPMGAPHILTVEDDGITADWGPVNRPAWCNKPFSQRREFLKKCLLESSRGRHVTYLETDDVSTVVAQTALTYSQEIIACAGRPNYAKPNGDLDNGANFGTILYGFGGEISPMIKHGLAGTALIPTTRVEKMLIAAIRAVRDGTDDEMAIKIAHAVPGVPIGDDVLSVLGQRTNVDQVAA